MNRYTQLTQEERYQIDKFLAMGKTLTDAALELGRSKSTISRELRRNCGELGYQPAAAHKRARDRRYRGGRPRIRGQDWRRVKRLLKRRLSPEQIRNRLLLEGGRSISHSWIYRYVFADRQAGGKLHRFLRHQGRRRRKYGSRSTRGLIPARVSIDERPQIVDDRSRIGDWEIDTIIGNRRRGALLSLTERKSKWLLLAKLYAKTAEETLYAALGLLEPYIERVHTITSDNGREFTLHQEIAQVLQAGFYFADPYCSWQRGTNENTNGLIRQYFPRTRNFQTIRQSEIDHAVAELNSRPRKALGWKTPQEVFCGITQVVALAS